MAQGDVRPTIKACGRELIKAGLARRADLLMGYQKGKFSFVLQKDRNTDELNLFEDKINIDSITGSAAMVFEETASMS